LALGIDLAPTKTKYSKRDPSLGGKSEDARLCSWCWAIRFWVEKSLVNSDNRDLMREVEKEKERE